MTQNAGQRRPPQRFTSCRTIATISSSTRAGSTTTTPTPPSNRSRRDSKAGCNPVPTPAKRAIADTGGCWGARRSSRRRLGNRPCRRHRFRPRRGRHRRQLSAGRTARCRFAPHAARRRGKPPDAAAGRSERRAELPPHRPRRRPRTRRTRHSGAQRRHAARRQGDRAPLDRTTGIYLRHQRLLALLERTGGASPHGSRRQYHHHFFDPGFPAVVVPDRLRRIEKRRRGVHPGSLAKQLAPKGIRVNSVAPGPVWTPLQVSGAQQPENIPGFGSRTPLGRAGQPVEVAPSYVFLASEESSYITAQIIGVTGGRYIL